MTTKKRQVIGLCGSLRKDSLNMRALQLAADSAPQDLSVSIADWHAIPPFNQDDLAAPLPNAVLDLVDRIRGADGVLFATPEYNFSIPGMLKNAIDWLSRVPEQPFDSKPVAILSASMGPLGGARVQYDLRRAMLFLNAHVLIKPEVFIGAAHTKYTVEAGFDAITRKFVGDQMTAFLQWIERMAP